jgi:hypothetical protein
VRISAVLFLSLALVACNSAKKNDDAVRQGVIDYLGQKGLNVQGMDVAVTKLDVNGSEADATVSITPKGGNPSQGMSMKYHLEQRDNKWAVVGRQDTGSSPHGGGAMPPAGAGAENPHGGGAMPPATAPGGAGKMPSPEDLPPAKKQ